MQSSQCSTKIIQQGRCWLQSFGSVKEWSWLIILSTVTWYAGKLWRLCQESAKKKQGKLARGIMLLQDNAPAYRSQVNMSAVTDRGFEILPHPPYSSDMAPSDWRRSEIGCFAIIVLQMYCYYKSSVAFPRSVVGWSVACDCGITWSYSLTFFYLFPKLESHFRGK